MVHEAREEDDDVHIEDVADGTEPRFRVDARALSEALGEAHKRFSFVRTKLVILGILDVVHEHPLA